MSKKIPSKPQVTTNSLYKAKVNEIDQKNNSLIIIIGFTMTSIFGHLMQQLAAIKCDRYR